MIGAISEKYSQCEEWEEMIMDNTGREAFWNVLKDLHDSSGYKLTSVLLQPKYLCRFRPVSQSSLTQLNYNGPPVKTTLSNFIVNQIFPILTLAASRATPFVQAAVSRLRQQVALTGRWWPVTLLPLRGGTHLILTPLHPRQRLINRPAPHCQGRRRWLLRSCSGISLLAWRIPAPHGDGVCCSRGYTP